MGNSVYDNNNNLNNQSNKLQQEKSQIQQIQQIQQEQSNTTQQKNDTPSSKVQPEPNNNNPTEENIKNNTQGNVTGNTQQNIQGMMMGNSQGNTEGNTQGNNQGNIKINASANILANLQPSPQSNPQPNPQVNTQLNTQNNTQINNNNTNVKGNVPVNGKNTEENDKKGKPKKNIIKIKVTELIPRNIHPRGLNNIGATCYMNSVLQNFYHCYDLSNILYNIFEKTPKEIKTKFKQFPMTLALLGVIRGLSFDERKSISPTKFKEIIGNNPLFRNFEANDSKTLTLYVLDNLNRELNEFYNTNDIIVEGIKNEIRNFKEKDAESIVSLFNNNYNSIIGELFHGLKISKYKCSKCNNCVNVYQIFNIITCPIEKTFFEIKNKNNKKPLTTKDLKINILDCFKLEEEIKIFNGQNLLYCEKCNKANDATSVDKIIFAPKILILFLDRGENNKFNCEVDFGEELDINNFLEVKGKNYNLIGVIEHLGKSGPSGHFIANCRHFDKKWYLFSDSEIHGPFNKYKQYGLPYLLFYRRID